MNNELDIDKIVKIETLPKIFQQLEIISEEVDKEIKMALSLDCTEESKTMVKNARARLNKINSTLETKRKDIKKAILEPYEEFNAVYDNLLKNKLSEADNTLKMRINAIEEEQLKLKEQELINFASEYTTKYNLQDYVSFDDIGLNITLSASMKSLKEQIVNFTEKVANDIKLIDLEEYADEIRLEYEKTLDFANSKLLVVERHKQLEEMEEKRKQEELKQKEEEQIVEQVNEIIEDEIIAPKEVLEEEIDFEERYEVKFTVWGTREEIKEIKNFIIEKGLKFE